MPRDLTLAQIESLKKPGIYRAAPMLYVRVYSPTCRTWAFRYTLHGTRHWHGLGPIDRMFFGDAKTRVMELQILLARGGDPLRAQPIGRAGAASTKTFRACAASYLEAKSEAMADRTHDEFLAPFDKYATSINNLPIGDITAKQCAAVLRPIWLAKAETAKKLQNRMSRVFVWAKGQGIFAGENPALLQTMKDQLASRENIERGNNRSLPFDQVPRFVRELKAIDTMISKALLFTLLSVGRSKEVRGTEWRELELESGIWTCPKVRMKPPKPKIHRVVLTPRIIGMLQTLPPGQGKDYVFRKPDGKMIGVKAMGELIRRKLPWADTSVHGLRSTFSTWAAETGKDPIEREHAMSHKVGNGVERAYQKSDLLARRGPLMLAWEAHCFGGAEGANAAPL